MMLRNLERSVFRGNRPQTVPKVPVRTYSLQGHQTIVRNHMRTHNRLLIIHGTGSGKTLSSVHVAKDYLDKNPTKNIVIFVTPAAVQKQFMNSAATVLSGGTGVYFTTYDNLTRFLDKLYKSRHETFKSIMRHTLIVADEAHYITEKTEKARVFYDIFSSADKVLLMTGTPIMNGLVTDLLPYAKILNPTQTITASDMNSFEKYFRCKVSVYKVPENSNKFPKLLPKNTIKIPLTNNQVSIVTSNRAKSYEYLKWTGGRTSKKTMGGWAFNRPIVSHKIFGNTEPKFEEFMKILQQRPHKTIVFFKEYVTLNKFARFLTSKRIKFERVTGKEKNKAEIIKRARPDTKIVYLLTSSAKEGLDFKGVRTVIFMDYPWVPSNYNQIVGRARRYESHINLPTTDRNVKVYDLAYVHANKPTLNMRSLQILNTKRAKISDMMSKLVSVSIEKTRCTSASPVRQRSPVRQMRPNRKVVGNFAIDPTTGLRYHLENMNVPLNVPLKPRKNNNSLMSPRLFVQRKQRIAKRKPTSNIKGNFAIGRLFEKRPKTARFSPKKGTYGIGGLFSVPVNRSSLKRKF